MRQEQRTRFKTFVIPKKKIIIGCGLFVLGLAIAVGLTIARIFPKQKQELAFSDEFYKTVLQNELNQSPEEKHTAKDFIKKILGFDPGDARTILKKSSFIYEEAQAAPQPEQTTPAPPPAEAPASQPPAEEHNIEEVKIAKGMEVSNKTNIKVNPEELAAQPLAYTIGNDGPQVLIVHTHTTESFTDSGKTKYSAADSDRSTDDTKNITVVGDAIAGILNENGIETIHDKTVHDYPSYSGAYTRSLATVRQNLASHPTIKVVLDVHRDGLVRADGTKLKVAADINGVKTAQCMFVIGSNANLTHDHWQENMKLACKLQQNANEMFPGLMRPLNLREERFNQQASMGSIIIEVGSNGNTLEEAVQGGKDIAAVLVKVLKKG